MKFIDSVLLLTAAVNVANGYWSLSGSDCSVAGNCVRDTSGYYESDEHCTFVWKGDTVYVTTVEFQFESGDNDSNEGCFDWVKVTNWDYGTDGYKCDEHNTMPSIFKMNNGMQFYFNSDSHDENWGFEFCAYAITDCQYSSYGAWGACSTTCGGGTQTRTRSITAQPTVYGVDCDSNTLMQSQACNTHGCPVDCVYTEWSAFGQCTEECAGGVQFRSRQIASEALHGGVECDQAELSDMQACNEHDCPVDCVLSDWGEWGACSAECAGGSQKRTRTVVTQQVGAGAACGVLEEDQACNEHPCPIDCETSEWSAFGECSATCGGGTQEATKIVFTHPAHGGAECGDLSKSQACNENPCPIDCTLSPFGEWSACDAECGGGNQHKDRTVVTAAQHGGTCGELRETQACNTQHCPCDFVTNAPAPGHEGCCPFENLIYTFDFSPESYMVDITGCCARETPFGVCEACLSVGNVKSIKVKGAGKAINMQLTADTDDLEGAACECAALCSAEENGAYWVMSYTWKNLDKLNCSCFVGANAKLNKVYAADDKASGFAGGVTDAHHNKLLSKV